MNMSPQIVEETLFLYHSVLLGIFVAAVYDIIRILRRVVRHNRFFISLEDIIYWIFCAFEVFYLLYKESSGVLRWFSILGIAFGMFLYLISISRFVVSLLSGAIKKCLHFIGKLLSILFLPFKKAGRKVAGVSRRTGRFTKKCGRFWKKKLTASGKMLKIILCKH